MKQSCMLLVFLMATLPACSGDDPPAAPDGAVDSGVQDTGPVDAGPPCSPAAVGDPVAGRWALSLFHFNVQYVAGGLTGIFPGRLGDQFLYNEQETEDLIIRESFVPLLGLLERHPTWQLTLEMQGLMLDIMAARFPADLVRLQALVASRQVELLSFHWSDQMLPAYPRPHAVRSNAMTRASALAAGVDLSPALWTQEGFFGRGVAEVALSGGWQIAIIGSNQYKHQHGPLPGVPFYELDGLPIVIASQGTAPASGAEVRWTFFDDGELLATGDAPPYLGDFFRHQPAAVQAYEDELACLETEGFRIGRVDDYVAALRTAGIVPQPITLLDGDWQPPSTRNVLMWMGGVGPTFKGDSDNEMLTGNVTAGWLLSAAETLVASAGASALVGARARLDDAWRELMLAQVSDSTGQSPWRGEVDYSLEHAGLARTGATSVIEEQLAALGWAAALVDTAAGTATERVGRPAPEVLTSVAAPVAVTASSTGRPVTTQWRQRPDGVFVLDVDIGVATNLMQKPKDIPVTVAFPWTDGVIRYTPGLMDIIEETPATDFVFTDTWLFAGNGLVGVDGGFLIKDEATVHLAAGFHPGANEVRFMDETLPVDAPARWRFLFVADPVPALDLARSTNVTPSLWVCATDASCGL